MALFARKTEELVGENVSTPDPSQVAADRVVPSDSTGASAAETIEEFRGKRGRPSGKSNSKRTADPLAEQQAKIQAELGKLYSAENWEAIVRAPADLRLALTGREYWNLNDKEVKNLSQTASTCAQYWLTSDPKYLALTLLMFNIATVYGARIALDVAEARKAKRGKPTSEPASDA